MLINRKQLTQQNLSSLVTKNCSEIYSSEESANYDELHLLYCVYKNVLYCKNALPVIKTLQLS